LVSGGFFGDIEIFNKSLRLFSVRAEEPSTLIVLSHEELEKIMRFHPQAYRELARQSLIKYMKFLTSEHKLKNFFSVGMNSSWWEQEDQARRLLGKKIDMWLEFIDERSPGCQ
jgi:CRP-like cAMP-binding protein